jgi:hypothetical protein
VVDCYAPAPVQVDRLGDCCQWNEVGEVAVGCWCSPRHQGHQDPASPSVLVDREYIRGKAEEGAGAPARELDACVLA